MDLIKEIVAFLNVVDEDFAPRLSERINFNDFALKVLEKSDLIVYRESTQIIGLVVLYCNDYQTQRAYISLVAVHPEYRGRGIAKRMMNSAIQKAQRAGMSILGIHTNNIVALNMYLSFGFINVMPSERSYLELKL